MGVFLGPNAHASATEHGSAPVSRRSILQGALNVVEAHTYRFETGPAVSVAQNPCSVDAESRQSVQVDFLRYATAEIKKF